MTEYPKKPATGGNTMIKIEVGGENFENAFFHAMNIASLYKQPECIFVFRGIEIPIKSTTSWENAWNMFLKLRAEGLEEINSLQQYYAFLIFIGVVIGIGLSLAVYLVGRFL